MLDFFAKLLDTSDFPSRWNCGNWDRFHGWLHIVSDLAIWAAYGAIPLALIYFCGRKKKELVFTRTVLLFAAFIVACGTVHLMEAIIFYEPIYRLSGLMKLITAVVSWITVIVVWKNLPAALKLPGMARVSESLSEELEKRRAAEQKASIAHEELQNLTALVAHDLRNPLSSALMMAEVVKEQASTAGASAISEQMGAVVLSLNRIRDSLKRLDRNEFNGGSKEARDVVDLNEVVEELKTFLASSIVANEAEIESERLPVVSGDRSKYFHLLTNLVENSIKYRSDETPLIRIRSESDGLWNRISVSDNGRGIEEGDLERVFQSEYRGRNGSREAGTGMGLSHCRRIVSGLGGRITAGHGELGGARFTIEIPVANPTDASEPR